MTYPITFSKLWKIHSHSELANLKKIDVKVTKNLSCKIKMCRQKIQCSAAESHCCSSTNILFYNTSNSNEIQSDSEGNDSLASIEKNDNSSFLSEFVEIQNSNNNIEVARDLELFKKCNDQLYKITRQTVSDSKESNNRSNLKSGNVNHLAMLMSVAFQNKKEVRFADECGHCLETIRVMTEPSDYPPKVNSAVIRRYRKAASLASIATLSSNISLENNSNDVDLSNKLCINWKITFKQPASEYVKFRETLDCQKVALENVMLKNDVKRMVGTIKVSNISYEKRVFVRYTLDNWKSYFDQNATYQSSLSKSYDTFSFEIELPKITQKDSKIEFCVCFVSINNKEFWDSNFGQNYILAATSYDKSLSSPTSPSPILSSSLMNSTFSLPHASERIDAYSIDYDNWSKFASWRILKTDTPYW